MVENKKFQFYGYSIGDSSVVIQSREFILDTGFDMDEFDKKEIENFKDKIISRNKILELFRKSLYRFNKYSKKISYLELIEIHLVEIMTELHDNGKVSVYNSIDEDEE